MSAQIFKEVTICGRVGKIVYIDDSTAQVLLDGAIVWIALEDLVAETITCDRAQELKLFEYEPQSNQP